MGLLADFFVANDGVAVRYEGQWTGAPENYYQTKGIGIVELSRLLAILENRAWDVSLLRGFELVKKAGDGEQFVLRLPEELVTGLSSLDEAGRAKAAEQWARTEELVRNRVGGVPGVLEAVAALAKRTREQTQQLYVWNSV